MSEKDFGDFMKTLILFLMLSGACFAQEQTLEERVTTLEQQFLDLPAYVASRCYLQLDYAGTSSMGCFDSVMSGVRTSVRMIGSSFYVSSYMDCKKYRLICE